MKKRFLWVFFILFLVFISGAIFFIFKINPFSGNNKKLEPLSTDTFTKKSLIDQEPKKEHYVSDNTTSVNANDLHVILDSNDLIIGGFSDGKWVNAEKTIQYLKGGETYHSYSEEGLLGEVIGSAPNKEAFITGTRGYYINFGDHDQDRFQDSIFSISAEWDCFPRFPKYQTTEIEKYVDILKSVKPSMPGLKIEEVITVDLDGDGNEEVLINATQITAQDLDEITSDPSETAKINKKTSLIIYHQAVNGSEKNLILYESVGNIRYKIAFVADLDNDQIMEFLVGIIDMGPIEAEGFAFVDEELVKIQDNKLTKLLHFMWHPFLKNYQKEQ